MGAAEVLFVLGLGGVSRADPAPHLRQLGAGILTGTAVTVVADLVGLLWLAAELGS